MVCESCGEKPKNTAKDFTKAVIEINNPETLVLLRKVVIPASMGTEEDVPVAIGKYRNVLLQYEANNHIYLYSSDGIPTAITANIPQEVLDSIAELEEETADLQEQIDDLKNSPDVVDIVDTYADLQAYDTSHLGDKDIIRVLTDETHGGASSYYRWDKQTETWTYIGSIQTAANTIFYADLSETGNTRHIYKNSDMTGAVSVQELLDANEDGQVILRMSSAQTPENFNDAYLQNTYVGVDDYQFLFLDNRNYYEYDGTATTDTSYYYSKSTIQLELTAGNNVTITGNTISATDTTYSNFVGTDGQTAGTAGLVPAPATTDAGKFLKADGTWDTAGGGSGPTVVQTTGTSTTDVMSQNAVTSMVYADPATKYNINIHGAGNPAAGGVVLLHGGSGSANAIAIGQGSNVSATGGIALGSGAQATSTGEMNIGTQWTSNGYNNSNYRLISGVYDGQSAHDAATVGQLNGRVLQNAGAPTTSTVGTVGQLLEDTTNGKLYICTDATNPYVWEEVGTGGGTTYTAGSGIDITGTTISVDSTTVAMKTDVPTITMTSTDPGEGSPLAANNFVGVYGGDPIIMDYSATEVNTGAKWIDGTAIYKKTVSLGNLPNNTEVSIAHGISNIGVVVKIEGAAKSSTTNNQIPLPFVSTTLANQIYVTTTPTDITVGCGSDRSTLYGYITLYYTKSA